MVTSFSDFINQLIGARFSFSYLWNQVVDLFESVTGDANVLSIWDAIKNFVSPIIIFLPYVLMALGFIVAFFGKKMDGLVKFLGFFVLGFFLGVYFLAPVIPPEVPIPAWVIGIVIAVIAAVMSKLLFVFTYSAAVLYSVYRLCYHGFFLDLEIDFAIGKSLTALAVAAIILILTLIFFKFVDMFLLSAFGAWMVTSGFAFGIIDLGAIPNLGDKSWILEVSIIGIITLLGFIFQFRTRRRY